MLEVGNIAPDFTLLDHTGKTVTLSELRGRTVVLFFYPKADTPGCTIEACAFSAAQPQFEAKNVVLFGISPDTVQAQEKFVTKFGMPLRLLADTEHQAAEAYGVWAEKSMYGKKYMGFNRETFVIDPTGKIAHIFQKVKPDGHAEEVLAALQQ